MSHKTKPGFTLIELVIVIGIIAVLSTVVIMILNPAELLRQSRDAVRVSNLTTINKALAFYQANVTGGYYGSSTYIYVSIPALNSDCSDLGLPSPPIDFFYSCVSSSTLTNVDGSGWIPVDFTQLQIGSPLNSLPIDPINTPSAGLYYTYIPGGSWELGAVLESQKYQSKLTNDGGNDSNVYEMGTNLFLLPLRQIPSIVSSSTSISVSSITPDVGANNGPVNITEITGEGFQTGLTAKLTKFGQSDILGADFTVVNQGIINGGSFDLSGAATGTWNVVITNPDNQTAMLAAGFTVNYIPLSPPNVSSVNPLSRGQGASSQSLTISGSNFVDGASVSFSGSGITVNSTNYVSSNELTANITISGSATTGNRNITVTNPDSQQDTCSNCFTVNAAPSVVSASPASSTQGASGLDVIISGSNFVDGAAVSFSGTGISINTTTFNNSTQLTVNIDISSGAPVGNRNITVTNPDNGVDTGNNLFTVNTAPIPPSVSSASPSSKPQGASNQSITINGSNFVDGASVSFSGTGITVNSTTYVSFNELTANITISGSATTGTRNVTVINPDSQQDTCSNCFTVNAAPSVVSASPASSTQGASGVNVIISGSNFVSGAVAAFSGAGITVSSTIFNNATQLTINIIINGSAATGARDITVTNPDEGVGTGSGIFTIFAAQQNTGYVLGSGTPTLVSSTSWLAPADWFSDENPPTLATQVAQATTTISISPSVTFSGFNFGISAGSTIDKICVLLNNLSTTVSKGGTQKWAAALSWNAGSSFTTENNAMADVTVTTFTGIERYFKDQSTAPGTTDPTTTCTTWGRSWSVSEMSSSNFAVRARANNSTSTAAQLRFDVAKVKIYFTPQ